MSKQHRNVKRLYPSRELEAAIAIFRTAPTVKQYVRCLTLTRSLEEQKILLSELSVTKVPLPDPTTPFGVQILWQAIDEFCSILARIGRPAIMQKQQAPSEPPELSASVKSVFDDAADQFISPRIAAEDAALSSGFRFLPKRLWFYGNKPGAALQVLAQLKGELGFDLFRDFEDTLTAQDRALQSCAAPSQAPINLGTDLRRKVLGDLDLLVKRFEDACEHSENQEEENPQDTEALQGEDRHPKLQAVAGVIGTFIRHAASIVVLGAIPGTPSDLIARPVAADNPNNSSENCSEEEFAGSIYKLVTRFSAAGLDEAASDVLAAAYARLVISDITGDIGESISSCLAAAFIVPTSLREALLLLFEHASQLSPAEMELSCCCYSELSDSSSLMAEVSRFPELFGLEQRAISNHALTEAVLDLTYASGGDFPPEQVLRLFFLRLDQIASSSTKEGWPTQICGLEELSRISAPFGATDQRTYENSLWMLATFVGEDLWLASGRRATSAIQVTKALLMDGFTPSAGLLFSYYLVTAALEVSDSTNPLAPFGSWREINEIVATLREKWSSQILKVISLTELLIPPERADLEFARAQLKCLAGVRITLAAESEASLISLRSSGNSDVHTTRLRHLISPEDWKALPAAAQTQLIALERAFDINAGDQAVFGVAGYSWAADYFNLVEALLVKLFSVLWSPSVLAHLQMHSAEVPRRPTVGASLRIWKDAIQNRDRVVLEKLRLAGISSPPAQLIEGLLQACALRNSATHAGDPPEHRARAAQELRIWVLRHLAEVHRHLGH